ncbi:uncharacterized protein LOC120572535 [Perca fluviatilis]|uniref:uncharacterized protein LOC120572535 n=1 Tax=Perca fluviatilis TaxID=8168 RepID=UPI001964AFD6|nr:uncharacterized protein LOC120572535 [Perca fluviatilis]
MDKLLCICQELWLGYNRPPQPKRCQLTQRTTASPQIKKRRFESEDAPETCQPVCEAEPATQILMTLMKLKLNLILGDIAHRFNVSTSMASIVISHWIDVMREQFKVIDCAESAMQRATNQDSRSDTFSQYKSRNTVKYIVAVAPNGLIMFISDAYAGRSSDKFITMDSAFLDYLRAGDEVMADRGFTIQDLLDERRVSLNIPAFTYRRNQLTNEETTRTMRVANVRIHVERAIQRLKVFKILSQTVPISMAPKLDNILTICAGLVNLRSPLISEV